MPTARDRVMQALYGQDIWADYRPTGQPPKEVEGWNGNHPSLAKLMQAKGSPVVVDVGVWKGQSTITMANAMREHGIDGCVVAVDTFLGSPEHWSRSGLFTRRVGMPDLYDTFLANAWHADLAGYIVPMPQTSATAALILRQRGITISVAHIDAAHEYAEVLRDAEEYWSLLEPQGFLIGDDYHHTWPGVVQAAGEFSARTRRPLAIEPPKWILQKP